MLDEMNECALSLSEVGSVTNELDSFTSVDLTIDDQYTVKFTVGACDRTLYNWSYLYFGIDIIVGSTTTC